MKRIDRETVQRILDTADIVEVVSDFVKLKKRGSNYIGLCPFHSERTPSFSVSKSRGICKCFSCGKGGSPVGFIMEHESMSYNEALRYLAQKYNIPIKEHEISEEERQADLERESILAVNEWAVRQYSSYMTDTEEGRSIGLSYFRERGLNMPIIEKFGLGYAPDRNILLKEAEKAGYSEKYLIESGLCIKSEYNNSISDRFKGRVIFPIYSLSGKVIAFGGRILKSEQKMAKYVNSPESTIYQKRKELYGFYQAKKSIDKKGYCILVEGYMDVISMSQSGIENIVASSGTSLTEEQARLIHRFTDKVLLMYDSDAAGIKAALRGVDILLAEGLDVSIVLLPEGEDPDSFAQSHSSSEVEKYIDENSEDFIGFKTKILLGEAKNDPIKKSGVINDIVGSIATIPDEIKRSVYCKECSRMLDVEEGILKRAINAAFFKRVEKSEKDKYKKDIYANNFPVDKEPVPVKTTIGEVPIKSASPIQGKIDKSEKAVLTYIVRYGLMYLCDGVDENGEPIPMSVLEIIDFDMKKDGMEFSNEINRRLFSVAMKELEAWPQIYEAEKKLAEQRRQQKLKEGIEKIRNEALDLKDIDVKEQKLNSEIDKEYENELRDFSVGYLQKILLSSPDDAVRKLATDLSEEKYQLSRFYSRYGEQFSEIDRLEDYISIAMNIWKYNLLEKETEDIVHKISEAASMGLNNDDVMKLMKRKRDLDCVKAEFGQILGERVFNPGFK